MPRPASRPHPDTYVEAFARGLKVLLAFDVEHPELSLSEVAERAGLTRAGARRLLLTLVALGYATVQAKRFRLTPRVLLLADAYLRSLSLPSVAMPFLQRVSQQLGESCSVAVLDGAEVVYVARVALRRIMTVNLAVGSRLPALWTSMGRVLLAHAPQGGRAAARDRGAHCFHRAHPHHPRQALGRADSGAHPGLRGGWIRSWRRACARSRCRW